jgi:hypothetical protein
MSRFQTAKGHVMGLFAMLAPGGEFA